MAKQTDILIIGGGASGLAAAIAAKRICNTLRVTILERNSRVGKKILATGNGRCNLGNKENSLEKYHGTCTAILPQVLQATMQTELFFQELGLYCKQETDGRLYPHANQASAVLDALRLAANEQNVDVQCEQNVTEIQPNNKHILVTTATEAYIAKSVIVATGGYAAPKTGSNGEMFHLLEKIGHQCTKIQPALVAFYPEPKSVRSLKGIRIPAKATVWDKNNKPITSEYGEVQFTEKTISGICIMNLSARCTDPEPTSISLCLFPEKNIEAVEHLLWQLYSSRSQWMLEDWLTGLFPKKVCIALLRYSKIQISFDSPVYCITPDMIHRVAQSCQCWRFPIMHRGNWNEAQVTAGGIPLQEVDNELQSKFISGLFFSGEVLDLHGECGGYNLDWAWRSGQYAGIHAANFCLS